VSDSGSGPVSQLVFFDLDETITRRDTLLPYAMGFLLRHRPWRVLWLVTVISSVLQFLARRVDEGRVKEAFIKATLGGAKRATLDAWTARFVPKVIANGTFANALERIAEHRRRGDYLVLMSASTDIYVPAIAKALGFNETLCTGVRWNGDRLDGALTTPNRKGAEKARCFAQARTTPGTGHGRVRQLIHGPPAPATRQPGCLGQRQRQGTARCARPHRRHLRRMAVMQSFADGAGLMAYEVANATHRTVRYHARRGLFQSPRPARRGVGHGGKLAIENRSG
jgi:phosphatidylglycerophosphatase C